MPARRRLVDTGSQLTFVPDDHDPDGTPCGATIELGGRALSVAGRQHGIDESYRSEPVLGFLGNDVLPANNWEIDLPRGLMTARDELAPFVSWDRVALDNQYDFIFAHASIDGAALRLGLDTGTSEVLWLGVPGEPGDTLAMTQDELGNPVTLSVGTGALRLGDEPERVVPVWRTESVPAIQQSNAELGGEIDGIRGLGAVGDRRLVLAGPTAELRLEPFPR